MCENIENVYIEDLENNVNVGFVKKDKDRYSRKPINPCISCARFFYFVANQSLRCYCAVIWINLYFYRTSMSKYSDIFFFYSFGKIKVVESNENFNFSRFYR